MGGLRLALMFALFVIAVIDFLKNKIPNVLVIFILVLQIIVDINSYSPINIGEIIALLIPRMMTAVILLFCLYIFFLIGSIGAGDLKLLTVTALGFKHPEIFTLVTFAIASIMSLIHLIRKQILQDRIRYLITYLNTVSKNKVILPYFSETVTTKEKKEYSIHFSIPIFIAYCIMTIYLWVKTG